jgi:hypothetical protein
MMQLSQGEILVVRFNNDSYLSFIEYCFVNTLISGVHVKAIGLVPDFAYTLILFVSGPGIGKLEKAVEDFGAKIIG